MDRINWKSTNHNQPRSGSPAATTERPESSGSARASMSLSALKQAAGRVIGRGYPLDRLVGRAGGRYVRAYHRVIPASSAAADHVHRAMWITPETVAGKMCDTITGQLRAS